MDIFMKTVFYFLAILKKKSIRKSLFSPVEVLNKQFWLTNITVPCIDLSFKKTMDNYFLGYFESTKVSDPT